MKISQMVLELQSEHNFVTDRWTEDQGKNSMSPNPTRGDIIMSFPFSVVLHTVFVTLSYDVASESVIMSCIKNDNPLAD